MDLKYYENGYLVVYTECINGKPVTRDVEDIGTSSTSTKYVNLPKYPMQLGFYKDGFWVRVLHISWIMHMNGKGNGIGGFACDYQKEYFTPKSINKPFKYHISFKFHSLPTGLCQALGKKYDQ